MQEGYTPLHLSVMYSDYWSTKSLIERGAKLDACTKDGNTPLHFAARWARVRLADLLLNNGARSLIPNKVSDSTIVHLKH